MRKIQKIFAFLFFLVGFLSADEQEISQYLLPENHPLKEQVDKIFLNGRPTYNLETLEAAGFKNIIFRGYEKPVVAKHPKIKGYLLKAYFDYGNSYQESYYWINRIQGAALIKDAISRYKIKEYFKVPKKWVYMLPESSLISGEGNVYPKRYILLVENMKTLSWEKNKRKYRKIKRTELLNMMFVLFEELGLYDCTRPDNLPWCKDGKLAFVDTHSYNVWPVNYLQLGQYLSTKMRNYWFKMTRERSPESYAQ